MLAEILGLALHLVGSGASRSPVPLTSLAQLRSICADLQSGAMKRRHGKSDAATDEEVKSRRRTALETQLEARLPPGQFRIGAVDVRTGTLTLDTQRSFRLFEGHAVLGSVEADDLQLVVAEGQALPPNPESLTLDLVVRPGDDVEPACTLSPSGDVSLGVEVVRASLLDRAGHAVAVLDSGEDDDHPAPPGGKPTVDVESAQVEGSDTASQQLTQAFSGLKPKLLSCFSEAVTRAPELDGALVLSFELKADGHVGPVTVVADSVQDEAMNSCVLALVKGVRVARSEAKAKKSKGGETAMRASVTLRFERR